MKVFRWTIRTRLALLYATIFLIAGAALVGVTYVLTRQAIFVQQTSVAVSADPGTPETDPLLEAARQRKIEIYAQDARDAVRDQTLREMTRNLIIALAALTLIGFGVGWLLARQSLRPVQRITATARRVASGNLDERISLDGPHDELRELADTFDEMLSRLDAAFDSQRRFVANASHELRTPLAIHRTLIEVALGRPDVPDQLRELGASLLQVNDRQQRLIDGLLTLAESERSLTAVEPVELGEIVRATAHLLRSEAIDRGVTMTLAAAESPLTGDPVLLERLVVNLLQNAIRHNHSGGQVWVSCTSTARGVQVRIANTGPAMAAERLDEIFEPFRRRTARVGSGRAGVQGNGLGLSIVRAVAVAHGGTVSAHPRDGGGLLVVATLPHGRAHDPADEGSMDGFAEVEPAFSS